MVRIFLWSLVSSDALTQGAGDRNIRGRDVVYMLLTRILYCIHNFNCMFLVKEEDKDDRHDG